MHPTGTPSTTSRGTRGLCGSRTSGPQSLLFSASGLLACLLLALPGAVVAQAPESGGTVVPRVVTEADAAQEYALFAPEGFAPGTGWPALILMDPGGQAMSALDLFRAGAERHGFVLLSAYGTSSDQPTSAQDTEAAVDALLAEALGPLGVDPDGIHLAGFSGTARVAWGLAANNPDFFAGAIGFGAGITIDPGDPSTPGIWFGGAGRLDFNCLEAWQQHLEDDVLGSTATFRFYDGPHRWPPVEVITEAVEWMAVHRPEGGARSWAEHYEAFRARAAALRRDGEPLEAWRTYRNALRALAPHGSVADVAEGLARLEEDPALSDTLERLENAIAWEAAARFTLRTGMATLGDTPIPSVEELVIRTGLPSIRGERISDDPIERAAADRARAAMMTLAGFYLALDFARAGDRERAVRSLEFALEVDPVSPSLCGVVRRLPGEWFPADGALAATCLTPPGVG